MLISSQISRIYSKQTLIGKLEAVRGILYTTVPISINEVTHYNIILKEIDAWKEDCKSIIGEIIDESTSDSRT